MSKKKKTRTHCLVVDADVAQAAGSIDSKSQRGTICREVLATIRAVCHRIAWTPAIESEWKRHAAKSLFASTWLVSMMQLGKVRAIMTPGPGLDEAIKAGTTDDAVRAILMKDRHLIEAALASDSRVLSLDARARFHFADLGGEVSILRPVLWVNPEADVDVVQWLNEGAPNERKRRLRPR